MPFDWTYTLPHGLQDHLTIGDTFILLIGITIFQLFYGMYLNKSYARYVEKKENERRRKGEIE